MSGDRSAETAPAKTTEPDGAELQPPVFPAGTWLWSPSFRRDDAEDDT